MPRVTPLVYEQRGEVIFVASARGPLADWLRNIQACPRVRVRVGQSQFEGLAEVTADPEKIADYLQHQYDRNPRMFGRILQAEGLPNPPSRADLLQLGPKRPMVTIHPIEFIISLSSKGRYTKRRLEQPVRGCLRQPAGRRGRRPPVPGR